MRHCPFDEMLLSFNHSFLFFFFPWVQYWNILLSGETALIKYYIMNNLCKCVRHIFHKVKMNSFLILPDVFVACRKSIWSEWQNKRIHPFIPVIWYAVPLYPPAEAPALSGSSDGIMLFSSCLINYFIF